MPPGKATHLPSASLAAVAPPARGQALEVKQKERRGPVYEM